MEIEAVARLLPKRVMAFRKESVASRVMVRRPRTPPRRVRGPRNASGVPAEC